MNTKPRQAATAVPVTLEEIDQVIRRGFRAMKPKVSKAPWGEVLYSLTPDDDEPQFEIRIQTSVFHGGQARGEGEDSIKVLAVNAKTHKPILRKVQRVHRTANWRDNLRSRIEEVLEEFESTRGERVEQKAREKVREEQEQLRKDQPREFASERERQIHMLTALAQSSSSNAGTFEDMLRRLRPGTLLSEKQLAWVEREYRYLSRR
jgi:hypothetical protein